MNVYNPVLWYVTPALTTHWLPKSTFTCEMSVGASQRIPEVHRAVLFLMPKSFGNTEHILRSYCFLWMLEEDDIPNNDNLIDA